MEIQKTGPLDSLRIAQLEAPVRRDSTNVPALIELGHLYLAQGLLEKAVVVDTMAIHLQPDAPASAEAFAHLGMILWSMGQTDGALKALDKAVFLRPELPEALLYRGIILFAGAQDMRAAARPSTTTSRSRRPMPTQGASARCATPRGRPRPAGKQPAPTSDRYRGRRNTRFQRIRNGSVATLM